MSIQGSINQAIGTVAGMRTANSFIKKEKTTVDLSKYKKAIKDARDKYEWESIRREHFEKELAKVLNKQEKIKEGQRKRFDILYGGVNDGSKTT